MSQKSIIIIKMRKVEIEKIKTKILAIKKIKMIKIALEKFKNNEDNFFKILQEKIIDDESPLDKTTMIKTYFNWDENGHIYFRFDIQTKRTHHLSDYYRYNYNFEERDNNKIEVLDSILKDIEINSFFGDEISTQNYI